jgi:hypothetical protein
MIGRTGDGWAVYLTDGNEVARYRGFCARRRALRFAADASARGLLDGR